METSANSEILTCRKKSRRAYIAIIKGKKSKESDQEEITTEDPSSTPNPHWKRVELKPPTTLPLPIQVPYRRRK